LFLISRERLSTPCSRDAQLWGAAAAEMAAEAQDVAAPVLEVTAPAVTFL